MSSFENQFQRAILELETMCGANSEKGFWAEIFRKYLMLMKALRLRPIQYAGFGDMWMRNALFFLVLISTIDLVFDNDNFHFVQLSWLGFNVICAGIYATIITPTNMKQFRHLGLSRWEDL